MRNAFIKTLTELAEKDKNVWLVTGDLGFSVFEDFAKRFPQQYLNVGVAEQDMVGVAAGLALSGKRPFCYSISTFASMRALEQVRNDVCYQNVPVTIVGGGSAFSYSTFGATHFALEDLSIMRALPNMTVFAPGDPFEVAALVQEAYRHNGPSYMRIAKKGEPVVHGKNDSIKPGEASLLKEGSDATIISTGRSLPAACVAAERLAKEGISVRVLSMHTLKPLDEVSIIAAAKETRAIVTVEEHSLIGGLASTVAETLVRHGLHTPLVPLAIPDEFPKLVGSEAYFLARYHLDETGVTDAVRREISS